ncbi:MAG: nucleoside hydrolase [Bacteroidales bacterium]|nr:nucleoside hydrolase [Bacteroidales bacterium]
MKNFIFLLAFASVFCSCSRLANESEKRIPVILDTDANNELDDQHAIAYMLTNQDVFDIVGITVNSTKNGGLIDNHYTEAVRILTLFNEQENIIVKRGADAAFDRIRGRMDSGDYDGKDAVEFIIEKARDFKDGKLVLSPIGKLTNIALAIQKAPDIMDRVTIIWLGSNYPDPGEYNLVNDTAALNYILNQDVHFEMVTVSYDRETGTTAIRVSLPEIDSVMPGKGPVIEGFITGRHGGTFNNFGDYSVNLFHHIDLYGDPPSRSLFDVGAVAVLKNPGWAESRKIPAPYYDSAGWVDQPDNYREIILWENFNRDSIVNDLYRSLLQTE